MNIPLVIFIILPFIVGIIGMMFIDEKDIIKQMKFIQVLGTWMGIETLIVLLFLFISFILNY